jgi:glycosyltransferase involved in cell wall biosynthesis
MKLVINIPCLNEEKTLPLVINELPKKIDGVSEIEIQVIDDGSTDKTVEVAKMLGVTRIIKHKHNMGLGVAFKHGLEAALEAGADILVNTDADNQYPGRYISELVQPIIKHEADIVIGNREPWLIGHFSYFKRCLQYWGNFLARNIAGSDVPDTVSGFRAYSKDAMLRINVTTGYSYVLDTIVQASKKGLLIKSIPIEVNPPTRKSRLMKNIFSYLRKSFLNVMQCYVIYEPFKTFMTFATLFFLPALFLGLRFLYYNVIVKTGGAHIQSLILATILFTLSGLMFTLGIIANLLGANRRLIEEQLYLTKKTIYK